MKGNIKIVPGTPNDDNREYLPEAIKHSDMVVNENGNNSLVYPARLQEFTEAVVDSAPSTWYEYVPASYDGSRKVPLVVSLHGGLMTGWGQAIYSSWTLVADREGFIVLFPDAGARRIWIVETEKKTLEAFSKPNPEGFYLHTPPEDPADNRDIRVIFSLIEKMKQKFNIDEDRIFLHGMSMGDIMSSQIARYFGDRFAGQAGSAGVTWPEVLWDAEGRIRNRSGPLSVWQTRMEYDSIPLHEEETGEFVRLNREYWKQVNGCRSLPEIKIEGENNFAFYRGEQADFVFLEVKNRDHGQTFDDAELVWDYLFSGVRRDPAGGRPDCGPSILPRKGDAWAIAAAAGCDRAYVHNRLVDMSGPAFIHRSLKYHGLNGGAIVRGEYLMTPVSFVAHVLEAELATSHGGLAAELKLKDGRVVQFARGNVGCVVDNRVRAMYCEAVFRGGELYVPIQWIFQRLFDYHASMCDHVLYITDHPAELSKHMAALIRDDILGASPR